MTTTTLATGSTTGFPFGTVPIAVVKKTVDFSKTPTGAGDLQQVINVPANTFVSKVIAHVEKADGGASTRTYTVGDGADDDGYIVATDAKTLAATASGLALTEGAPNTVTGYSGGKFYAAADTIDLKSVQALTTGKITVIAIMVNCAP